MEHKLVQNLQNSGLCQNEEEFHRNIEEWEKSLEGLDRHRQELVFVEIVAAKYSKTCVKWPKRLKIGFQYQLSLNAGQKYCRMLQGEHSAILSAFIKLPFVIKILYFAYFLSGRFTQVLL